MSNIVMYGARGEIATLHPKGFGFVSTTLNGRNVRIYFHLADSDGTAFQIGDRVAFDLGFDDQQRTRAYAVRPSSEVLA